MRRSVPRHVESLEARSLLSGAGGLPMIPAPTSPSDVSIILTTDQSTYETGEPVKMTLTETNVSGHEIAVSDGPSIDGFYVTHDGATVWRSNPGPVPLYIALHPLQPGQSFTLTSTWDGVPNEGSSTALTGVFEVHSQVSGAAPVTIQIGPTAPASPSLQLSIATDRARYKVRAPILITITETNVGNQAASVGDLTPGAVTIARRGVEVWKSLPLDPLPGSSHVLLPGQSREYRIRWPGAFSQHVRQTNAGEFRVHVSLDGLQSTSTFAIGK